ncbi:MAG: hypothetical protein LBG65_02295 [Puniceicoccales bacterium]|jgi:hypothetical protein|nr:hypothetical protein [Puniceicoccales bacterium]
MPETLHSSLRSALAAFNGQPLREAALGFFKTLGYSSQRTVIVPKSAPRTFLGLFAKNAGAARPTTGTEKINPLAPHYLVYVRADGEVRLACTQVKTILGLFRELALGKTEPCAELCRLFDRATANGADMGHPSRLIRSAIESITATFQQKLATGLQTSRQFILPAVEEQPRANETEFALVTWLVLHPSAGQASTT